MKLISDSLYFISDLHLDPQHPEITEAFHSFLAKLDAELQQQSLTLFILGDLFEAWIGDDFYHQSLWVQTVLAPLKALTDKIEVYFIHGNRDFLIGSEFEKLTGVRCLPEIAEAHFGKYTLKLCHGDHLCTQDVDYMKFRAQMRNPQFQAMLLSKSIEERLAIAQNIRAESKDSNSMKSDAILDVAPESLVAFMQENPADLMIHGHTHRPAIHQDVYPRIVLSDWQEKATWLKVSLDEKSQLQCDLVLDHSQKLLTL